MRKKPVTDTSSALKSIREGWEKTDGSFRLDRKPRRRIRIGTKWLLPKPLNDFTKEDADRFHSEHEGEFIVLPIEQSLFGFGRVIRGSTIGFYGFISPTIPPIDQIEPHPLLFIINILYGPLFTGRWRVIGKKPLPESLKVPIKFYRHVYGSDFLEIRVRGELKPRPYAGEDLTKMEDFNGWWAWSVEERLRSRYAGRPDLSTERRKIPDEVAERLRREYFERQRAADKNRKED